METKLIDTPDELSNWCDRVGKRPLAVDTESDHFHAYQARVCLIQLADFDRGALVDPLALEPDQLAPLFELFDDPGVQKVFHAARNDLNELDRDWGVGVTNLFDTRTAARFLGYRRNSLDWLLEHLLGVEPGKGFSRYDWAQRPLSDEAIHYAAEDVRHLLELRDRLSGELRQEGWYEAFRQRCEYIGDCVQFQASDFDPDGWRELRGISKLGGRGRAAARALYRWRHQLCTRKNRSAVTIFPNHLLIRLAKKRPTDPAAVRSLSGIPDPLLEHTEQLAEVIDDARSTDAPPASVPDVDDDTPPPPEQRARYEALRTWRNDTAGELDIPSEFVATNATLSRIAANPPETTEQLARFEPILAWHVELLGDEMLQVLANSR